MIPTANNTPSIRRWVFQEEVVATSQEKRSTAADEKAYLDQAQEMLAISPPVLAYVPDRWPDGRSKDVRGWQVGVRSTHCSSLPRAYITRHVCLLCASPRC